MDEIKTEQHMEALGSMENLGEGILDPGDVEALEAAQDALAFSQSLWDLFADQALHNDGDDPNYDKMENIIDAINGELAAAVLFINSLNIDAERALKANADLLEEYRESDKDGASAVPMVVIEGNRRLATRVKNTKVILAAKNRTKLVPSP